MHVNLKFDFTEAVWRVELPQTGETFQPNRPNAPLSVIVGSIRSACPKASIDIDHGSLFAYHAYKALLS